MLKLLADSPPLRRFFAAFLPSQVGTGAAVVALPLVAYERLHSSWAISLVLLGEFLPGVVLAPLFGTLADRCSRRRLAVYADLARALCFLGIAATSSFVLTFTFALLAGVGSALFRPAVSAALPDLVPAKQRSQVTALFWASINSGMMLGPALAAPVLLVAGPSALLLADAATFLLSALILSTLDLGRSTPEPELEDAPASGLWNETRAGARAVSGIRGVPLVLGVGSLVVLTGAMFNVIAPLLATGPLHAGRSGYGLLMALYGAGTVAGSWFTARAGSGLGGLRRRWVSGIALSGITMTTAALAPELTIAMVAFLLIGVGETLMVGPEARLVQEMVPQRLLGRAFGLKDVLENIAFVVAFLCAGGLAAAVGVRPTFVGAGLLTLALAGVARLALRKQAGARTAVSARRRLPVLLISAPAGVPDTDQP